MTLTLSLPFLLLAGFSLLLFIGVMIFCYQAGMFDAGGGSGFVAGLDSLFATIVYLICWAVPSLLAWAVWATWWR